MHWYRESFCHRKRVVIRTEGYLWSHSIRHELGEVLESWKSRDPNTIAKLYVIDKRNTLGSSNVYLQVPAIYTGCPRKNVQDFGRAYLMLKYTDITQNTYVQIGTVTEIMDREKWGLRAGLRTEPVGWQCYPLRPWVLIRMTRFQLKVANELHCMRNELRALHTQFSLRLLCEWLAG